MKESSGGLTLAELSRLAGVSPRTTRYYIQQGLLPSPGSGRGTRYDRSHLERIQLIKALQEHHLPLARIRRRLQSLSDEEVHDSLGELPERNPEPESASDYVRSVLSNQFNPQFTSKGVFPYDVHARTSRSLRSTWEHYSLTPDIEIHVRRPLSREQNRKLTKLIEWATNLFQEDAN